MTPSPAPVWRRWCRVDGVRIRKVGDRWVAFSSASGLTTLLNDEAVAILDVLADGPADASTICERLADPELANDERLALQATIDSAWYGLADLGLVRPTADGRGP